MDNVGIVILHYGNRENTRECLQSTLNNLAKEINIYIVVVINPQKTEQDKKKFSQILKEKFQKISIIENDENIGFSKAINLGIKKVLELSCQYVVLINNDTVLTPNLISELVTYAKENPNVGLISPKIYFAKGYEYHKERYKENENGKVIWYAGGIIDWDNIYAHHRGVDEVDAGQYNKICETLFATGCCMLIKKEVIEKIGFLDEKYFLYFEDVDYSLRAKKGGFQIIYYPKAYLWHKNAASSGKPGSSIHVYYQTRNRLYFGFKYGKFWTKKSLFLESLRIIGKNNIQRKACFDYYLGRMGKSNIDNTI